MIPFVIVFDIGVHNEPIDDSLYLFAENIDDMKNIIISIVKQHYDSCIETDNCNSFAHFCAIIRREPFNMEDYFTVHYFENDTWRTLHDISFINKVWHTIR